MQVLVYVYRWLCGYARYGVYTRTNDGINKPGVCTRMGKYMRKYVHAQIDVSTQTWCGHTVGVLS